MMKRYVGNPDRRTVHIKFEASSDPGPVLKHKTVHSPEGFDWGDMGPGAHDLALAILLDAFDASGKCITCRGYGTIDADSEPVTPGSPAARKCGACAGSGISLRVQAMYPEFATEVISQLDASERWTLPWIDVIDWGTCGSPHPHDPGRYCDEIRGHTPPHRDLSSVNEWTDHPQKV